MAQSEGARPRARGVGRGAEAGVGLARLTIRDVAPFAGRGVVPHRHQMSRFRVHEAFVGWAHPSVRPSARRSAVGALHDTGHRGQCAHDEDDGIAGRRPETRSADCDQHAPGQRPGAPIAAHPCGSTRTAVPYATTSLMVWPISPESKRIMTTALAPNADTKKTRRTNAKRRVSST